MTKVEEESEFVVDNVPSVEEEKEVEESASFSNLGLDARLTRAISQMGLETPTVIQAQSIPLALAGKDILAKAPTGSGKTLAYVLPVLHKILNHYQDASLPINVSVDSGNKPSILVQAAILVPTKELALQVTSVVNQISRYCTKESLRFVNLAQEDSLSLQQSALQATNPNLIISTPSRLLPHLSSGLIKFEAGHFHTLVLDEADLILSFGFQADIDRLVSFLPKLFQTLLLSATLSDDLDDLKALLLHAPVIVKVSDEIEGGFDSSVGGGRVLKQYSIPASGDDKFLFTFVTLKLNLLKGKILIFCNSTDRAYKLKLYLDQFGIKCAVLNAELPLLSRHGIVDQFNRSVFDILIASDESTSEKVPAATKKSKEGGVARGVDFKRVDVVFNFDFPESLEAYTHRVGRTARGKEGRGTALSLIDELTDSETSVSAVREAVKLTDFPFPMDQLEAFRYRSLDALRSTTKAAVKKARALELSKQILASQKLATSFFANRPKDLEILRNDAAIRGSKNTRVLQHLKHVPGYLLASVGAKASVKQPAVKVDGSSPVEHQRNGLYDTKKQKREFGSSETAAESGSKDYAKKPRKFKPEQQIITAPDHLKLPQTAPSASTGNYFNYRRGGPHQNRNRKRNDPLKSGKLMK